jgi:hypothetical protein
LIFTPSIAGGSIASQSDVTVCRSGVPAAIQPSGAA